MSGRDTEKRQRSLRRPGTAAKRQRREGGRAGGARGVVLLGAVNDSQADMRGERGVPKRIDRARFSAVVVAVHVPAVGQNGPDLEMLRDRIVDRDSGELHGPSE